MAWTIVLEDEKKHLISSVSKEFYIDNSFFSSKRDLFKLIKYLDPYGDVVFNHLQLDDLSSDLIALKEVESSNRYTDTDVIEEIFKLIEKCRAEPHTYIVFYGD